jgi:hypothetical protein
VANDTTYLIVSPFGKVEPARKDLLDPALGKQYWEWTEEQVNQYK